MVHSRFRPEVRKGIAPDADWIPRPRQDIDYVYFDLPLEAERIRHKLERKGRRPPPAQWPSRRPTPQQAQIGDVLAGNVELRATCVCGHSAKVVPALLSKFGPYTRIADIRRKVRCTQCRRYGTLNMVHPEGR